MKHIHLFESFDSSSNKYDDFINAINALSDERKDMLSDLWAGPDGMPSPDPLLAAFGSAVWATLGIGKGRGFRERAIKYLRTAGSQSPEGDLEDFVDTYGRYL